ncbi:MAG: hypothetical protein KJ070_10565 [Verrucomicrobia bacterium]|nr:hypothetical protein [Verrucomicrobiota bacterium]
MHSPNGFYHYHNNTTFGSGYVIETESPFAPRTFIDPVDQEEYFYLENGQGGFYLREGSPFVNAGTSAVAVSLKSALAKMTTVVPELLVDDITTSMTRGPTPIRDAEPFDIGYHYPVIDYVLNSVTVNNCTLNIDQGTVLAYEGWPHPWGIRLNPGGRLNVNGVPTNRVFFARLEAIQENPVWDLVAWGPMLTWRDLYFQSGFPKPYPEAKLRYADFPTMSGGWNGHCDVNGEGRCLSFSYPVISQFEVEGCLFQGGWFYYDDGGPTDRSLKLRNNVFERCAVGVFDSGKYAFYCDLPAFSSQVVAANNLFYRCFMLLFPVQGETQGASWTFVDNIFDNVTFGTGYYGLYNGPVGINNYNAYIGMSQIPDGANRLSPAAPTTTDPDLTSLSYQTGSLGNFYLPFTATLLIDKGSRSASTAGQYHFTTLVSSAKEATGQVDIGPHYLAVFNGDAADSNGDGVPDYIADRDGDGSETGEIPWMPGHYSTSPSILNPGNNSTLSGTTGLRIDLGADAASVESVFPLVDGRVPLGAQAIKKPAESTATVEIDTRYLENGNHKLLVGYSFRGSLGLRTEFSPTVNVSTLNDIRQPSPEQKAGNFVALELAVPATLPDYTIWFFNSGYPKANDPFAPSYQVGYRQGQAVAGVINLSEAPGNLGYGDGSVDPWIYSITELSGGGQGAVFPNVTITQPTPWTAAAGPSLGWWAAAYSDWPVEYEDHPNPVVADKYSYSINPLTWAWNDLWRHGVQLDSGWRWCGILSSAGSQPTIAIDPGPMGLNAQTWPLRLWNGARLPNQPTGTQFEDTLKLLGILNSPNVRNFYGLGHNVSQEFLGIDYGTYAAAIRHRYRFAFLDGCQTGLYEQLLSAFGATRYEINQPQYPASDALVPIDMNYYNTFGHRPGAFLAWKSDVTAGLSPGGTDDRTGTPNCSVESYAALCNWHNQFLFSWVFGSTLLNAIGDANDWAFSDSSDPAPEFNLQTSVSFPQADGTIAFGFFRPETCLRVYGYGDLKFNWYNYAADWPR